MNQSALLERVNIFSCHVFLDPFPKIQTMYTLYLKKPTVQPFQTKTNNTSEHTPTTTPKEYKHQNHKIIIRKNDTQKSQQHKHKQQQEQPQQHHGRTTR
jgi:hypothetical protein